jgi:hypothetical protein
MRPEWQQLGLRLEKRLVRTIDVISILLLDAVLLALGYAVIRSAEALSGSGNRYFEVARTMSGMLFLLLYLVMVIYDFKEFVKR